jgi:ribosomal protein L20A (L18A)
MEAASVSLVREKALTRLGSDHGVKRTQVKIDKVEAVKA